MKRSDAPALDILSVDPLPLKSNGIFVPKLLHHNAYRELDLFVCLDRRQQFCGAGGRDDRVSTQSAVESRDVIGQAKGVLMERNGVDGVQALQILLTTFQEPTMKPIDVALWLVAEHESQLRRPQ